MYEQCSGWVEVVVELVVVLIVVMVVDVEVLCLIVFIGLDSCEKYYKEKQIDVKKLRVFEKKCVFEKIG